MTNINGHNVVETIKQALGEVQTTADTKSIIGEPIVVGGVTLIPVSKVSVGVGIGGGTYGKAKTNEAGGGGTGLTVTPVAFITVTEKGEINVLNIGADDGASAVANISGAVSEIDKALDSVPGILDKLKLIFMIKDKEEEKTTVKTTVKTQKKTVDSDVDVK